MTFVIKQFGNDTSAQDLRQAFFDVLMDSRYDLLEALAPPIPALPIRRSNYSSRPGSGFVPVVRRSATTLPGTTALRYLSFIAAGDALAALDEIGPEIGLEISADGFAGWHASSRR